MHKYYFLIKELKKFDETVALCNSRGERLVEIKSEAENEFIFRTIVKPAAYGIWQGATNILGITYFKWL